MDIESAKYFIVCDKFNGWFQSRKKNIFENEFFKSYIIIVLFVTFYYFVKPYGGSLRNKLIIVQIQFLEYVSFCTHFDIETLNLCFSFSFSNKIKMKSINKQKTV